MEIIPRAETLCCSLVARGRPERERERERERQGERGNTDILRDRELKFEHFFFYKDCSLGSVKTSLTGPC